MIISVDSPAVREFIQRIVTATPEEAVEIALALQRELAGKEEPTENVIRLRADARAAQAAEKAWEEDRVRFVADVFDRNPPPVGEKAEKIKARAIKKYEQAIKRKQRQMLARQLALDHRLANDPKDTILVTGHTENINGRVTLCPDVIKLMHRTFVLPPGKHEVPLVVAEAYRALQAARAEAELREAALSAADGHGMEYNQLIARQKEIDVQTGVRSDFGGGLVR